MDHPDALLLEVLEHSRALGFLGRGPVADHVRHAEVFVAAAPASPATFVDLGSGGGVPGLVLALRWPASRGWLVDGQLRRVRFLDEALARLGAGDRIRAVHGRAEELAHDPELRGAADVVTARSFAAPAVTAECAVGFLRPGGVLLVAEPPDDRPGDGERWPADGLRSLGLVDEGVVRRGAGSVRRLRLVSPAADATPRRPAAMARRPAF